MIELVFANPFFRETRPQILIRIKKVYRLQGVPYVLGHPETIILEGL